MNDAELEKLLSQARERTEQIVRNDAEAYALYRSKETQELIVLGGTDDFLSSTARMALLEEMSWSARPVLVLDPENDTRLKGIHPDTIGAMMGAPIISNAAVVAYLYVESTRRNKAFSQTNLKKVAELAKELSGQLPQQTQPTSKSGIPGTIPWFAAAVMVMLLTASMVVLKPTEPKPYTGPPKALVQSHTIPATTVAKGYLTALQSHQPDSAYSFLDARLKQKLTPSEYEQRISKWLQTGNHEAGLQTRRVKDEKLGGNSPTVTLYSEAPGEADGDWHWRMVSEDGEYKLSHFEGGPDLGVSADESDRSSNP